MPHSNFLYLYKRYEKLTLLGDPLVKINELVEWSGFFPILEKTINKEKKSNAGAKPYDSIFMFKILVIQHLFNLSDKQTEFQINDRLSFQRFLDICIDDAVPDYTTVWGFREKLSYLDLTKELFNHFEWQLERAGFLARKGQILDATIVEVPVQHNKKAENELVKAGKVPEVWHDEPDKLCHKDLDARWTKKNDKSYYGYKSHISADVDCKLIRCYEVTDAASSDHNQFDKLLDKSNTGKDVSADAAYRSEENEEILKKHGFNSKIHYRGKRNKPLSAHKKKINLC